MKYDRYSNGLINLELMVMIGGRFYEEEFVAWVEKDCFGDTSNVINVSFDKKE